MMTMSALMASDLFSQYNLFSPFLALEAERPTYLYVALGLTSTLGLWLALWYPKDWRFVRREGRP